MYATESLTSAVTYCDIGKLIVTKYCSLFSTLHKPGRTITCDNCIVSTSSDKIVSTKQAFTIYTIFRALLRLGTSRSHDGDAKVNVKTRKGLGKERRRGYHNREFTKTRRGHPGGRGLTRFHFQNKRNE